MVIQKHNVVLYMMNKLNATGNNVFDKGKVFT